MKQFIFIVLLLISRVVFADNLPTFSIQPTNQTVSRGSTATFVAAATGATSYQWLFNGTNISGATSATFQVVSTQTTNAGYYMVIAKNSAGWVPSQMAYLFVDYSEGGVFPNLGGMLPLSNTNNTYFQGDIECGFGPPVMPTNGTAQIMAGPQLDQMQSVGAIVLYRNSPVANRFFNGYYNAPDQSVSTIAPGQAFYYSVIVRYTNNGTAYTQPSTVMKLNAGTNGSPAPPSYGLKFPTWFAGEGLEPLFSGGSPTNQLRVSGETFSLTNKFFAYTDYGTPTAQWRRNGTTIPGATGFTNISPGYSGPQVVSGIFQAVLTITNAQQADVGVYDLAVFGNSWLISRKTVLSIQATNGQGVFQQPKFLGTNFVCDLIGAAGRNYKVQQSTNLFNWSDLVTLSNISGTVTFTNPPASVSAQFYRTVLLP